MDVEDFLEHYGVKGQKWGVRNKKKRRPLSDDHRTVSEIRKYRTPVLSNKELEVANKRMNLEQNYNRLNPAKVSFGKKFARDLFKTLGISSLPAAITFLSSDQGQKLIKRGKAFIGPSIKKGVRTIGR